MCAYNYRQHKIHTIQDVDSLVELVAKYGDFTSKDFNYFWRQAFESETPSRIKSRLHRKLRPLIRKVEEKKKTTTEKEQTVPDSVQPIVEKPKPDIFGKTYHASDFSLDNGVIKLGEWALQSKRIKKVHPSWLELIDHEFKIACESRKLKTFHFVPYTDLSFILNAIAEKMKEQEESKTRQAFENDKNRLTTEIGAFLNNSMCNIYEDDTRLRHKAVNLYDIMSNYGIADIPKEDFINSVHGCNLRVPFEDVEIYDGYVVCHLDRCEFVNTPEWEQCKDYLWDSFPKKYFQVFGDELIAIYQQQLAELEKLTDAKEIIRINTYLSAKSFEEAMTTRVKIPMTIVRGTFAIEINIPKHLAFPVSFLSKSVNEGFSVLCNIHYGMLKTVLFSEIYKFSDDTEKSVQLKAKRFKATDNNDRLKKILSSPLQSHVRIVTNYYKSRLSFRGSCYLRDLDECTILEFSENCSHFSDWDNSWWNYFKSTEFHKSHLVIDYDNHELTLIPLDQKYSIYRFSVSTQRGSMDEAALVLIKYFTSSLDNKRQYFRIPLIFREWGLYNFRRL
ncbi:MAG: hypothetical protein K2I69_07290 [Muribaculaceae bacterium]|nr:hypothetical protein [Muribaculaceae bacterium]